MARTPALFHTAMILFPDIPTDRSRVKVTWVRCLGVSALPWLYCDTRLFSALRASNTAWASDWESAFTFSPILLFLHPDSGRLTFLGDFPRLTQIWNIQKLTAIYQKPKSEMCSIDIPYKLFQLLQTDWLMWHTMDEFGPFTDTESRNSEFIQFHGYSQ